MIKNPFPIPIALENNLEFVDDLRSYILSIDKNEISSNIATTVKHNLSESEFNFFESQEPCVIGLRNWIGVKLGETINTLNGTKNNFDIWFKDSWYHITKTPRKGLLCLFPSFLAHTQQLYTGDEERVVVAFNSCIQNS